MNSLGVAYDSHHERITGFAHFDLLLKRVNVVYMKPVLKHRLQKAFRTARSRRLSCGTVAVGGLPGEPHGGERRPAELQKMFHLDCGQVPDTRLFPEAWHVCGPVAFAPYALPGSLKLGARIAEQCGSKTRPDCVVLAAELPERGPD
jgi:hypothetical protein